MLCRLLLLVHELIWLLIELIGGSTKAIVLVCLLVWSLLLLLGQLALIELVHLLGRVAIELLLALHVRRDEGGVVAATHHRRLLS